MKVEIKGLDELQKKLEALGKTGSKKVVRKALREAMKPLYQEIKASIPVETGEQKKAVKLRAIKRSRSKIGVKVELADPDGKLGALPTEYGWKTKSGHKIEAQSNIRGAFEKMKNGIADKAEKLIVEGIGEEL